MSGKPYHLHPNSNSRQSRAIGSERDIFPATQQEVECSSRKWSIATESPHHPNQLFPLRTHRHTHTLSLSQYSSRETTLLYMIYRSMQCGTQISLCVSTHLAYTPLCRIRKYTQFIILEHACSVAHKSLVCPLTEQGLSSATTTISSHYSTLPYWSNSLGTAAIQGFIHTHTPCTTHICRGIVIEQCIMKQ